MLYVCKQTLIDSFNANPSVRPAGAQEAARGVVLHIWLPSILRVWWFDSALGFTPYGSYDIGCHSRLYTRSMHVLEIRLTRNSGSSSYGSYQRLLARTPFVRMCTISTAHGVPLRHGSRQLEISPELTSNRSLFGHALFATKGC